MNGIPFRHASSSERLGQCCAAPTISADRAAKTSSGTRMARTTAATAARAAKTSSDKGGKDYGGYGGSGNEDFHRDKGGKDYGGYGVVCFAKALKYINELRTSA